QYLGDSRGIEQSFARSGSFGADLTLIRLDFQPNPVESSMPLRFVVEFQAQRHTRISELTILFYSLQGVRIAVIDMRRYGLSTNIQAGNVLRAEGQINSLLL